MSTQSDLAALNAALSNAATSITSAQTSAAAVAADIAATPPPPPPPALVLATVLAQSDQVGVSTSIPLSATGGTAPYKFQITALPPGLALTGATISGNPTTSGTFTATLTATDSGVPAQTVSESITFTVAAAPPPPPPPPPPTSGGKLWIGSSWGSSAANQAVLTDFGLAETEAFYVNNNNTVFPWTGARMFAENNFNSGTAAGWTANAKACIAAGCPNIRLSWEFNTAFTANNSGWWPNNPAGFLKIWAACYTAYSNAAVAAGLPGGWFNFCWNPDKGGYSANGDITQTLKFYPTQASVGSAPPNGSRTWLGDVGTIGLYVGNIPAGKTGAALFTGYNTNLGWNPKGVTDLATQNGHDIATPEWSNRGDQWGDGLTDDGPYMTATVDWAAAFVQATGRNAYLGAWIYNYPSSTPWNMLAGPNQVAAIKAAVVKYRAAGIIG